MSEPDAFRWIQKTSMDQRLAMRAVAERVLEGSMAPGSPANSSAASTGAADATDAAAAKPDSGA
jgi:response regulator NasT